MQSVLCLLLFCVGMSVAQPESWEAAFYEGSSPPQPESADNLNGPSCRTRFGAVNFEKPVTQCGGTTFSLATNYVIMFKTSVNVANGNVDIYGGRFDLIVDGTTIASSIEAGNALSKAVVAPGQHTVQFNWYHVPGVTTVGPRLLFGGVDIFNKNRVNTNQGFKFGGFYFRAVYRSSAVTWDQANQLATTDNYKPQGISATVVPKLASMSTAGILAEVTKYLPPGSSAWTGDCTNDAITYKHRDGTPFWTVSTSSRVAVAFSQWAKYPLATVGCAFTKAGQMQHDVKTATKNWYIVVWEDVAALLLPVQGTLSAVSSETSASGYPFNTYYEDGVSLSLYTASTLGRSQIGINSSINRLGLKVAAVPGEALKKFRIRAMWTAQTTITGTNHYILDSNNEFALEATILTSQVVANQVLWFDLTSTIVRTSRTDSLLIEVSEDSDSYNRGGGTEVRTLAGYSSVRIWQDSMCGSYPFTRTNCIGLEHENVAAVMALTVAVAQPLVGVQSVTFGNSVNVIGKENEIQYFVIPASSDPISKYDITLTRTTAGIVELLTKKAALPTYLSADSTSIFTAVTSTFTIQNPEPNQAYYFALFTPTVGCQFSVKVSTPAPVIAFFSPTSGTTQGSVSLVVSGTDFGGSGTVTIGGASCVVTLWSSTSITCTVPSGTGAGKSLQVSTGGNVVTAAQKFSYSAPSLAASNPFSPATGPTSGGTTVLASGNNFGNEASKVTVSIGANSCTNIAVAHTTLKFKTPPGTGAGQIVSIDVDGQKTTGVFSYDKPVVTNVFNKGTSTQFGPTQGGIEIEIQGSNFGVSSNPSVVLGGQPCTLSATPSTQTRIYCSLPTGQGTVNMYVTVAGQTSTSDVQYTYALPLLSGNLQPQSGSCLGGYDLTISGANFGTSAQATEVTVSSKPCNVTSTTDSQIVCKVPAGEGKNQVVTVRVSGSSAATTKLFHYSPPAIASLSSQTCNTDCSSTVVISGTDFGNPANPVMSVVLDFQPLTITAHSLGTNPNTLTVQIPPGQGKNKQLTVNVAGQTSNFLVFNYLPPTIVGVTSSGGFPTAGGITVTVTGTNFGTSGTVKFSTSVCSTLTWTHSTITCQLPAGQGSPAVSATVADQIATYTGFTYDPPAIISIEPIEGARTEGSVITITGTNFGVSGSITVGGNPCFPIYVYSGQQITCKAPAGRGTSVPVVLTVAAVPSTATYKYRAPIITFSAPALGGGGGILTVRGSSFDTSGKVEIGTTTCPSVSQQYTHTEVLCTVPAGSGSNLPIKITAATGLVSNVGYTFSYAAIALANFQPTTGPTDGKNADGSPVILTFTGTSFSSPATATVGGKPCPVTSVSSTAVTCTLPAGEGKNLPVTLTMGGSLVSTTFSYDIPIVSNILYNGLPAAGGSPVTIQGRNFGLNPVVYQGTSMTTQLVVASSTHTQIVATSIAGQGKPALVVSVAGQVQATPYSTITYDAPRITSVNPTGGATQGAFALTVNGINFGPTLENSQVTVGSENCPITSLVDNKIICTAPVGAGVNRPVQFVCSGASSNSDVTFSYDKPSLISVNPSPTTDTTAGGKTITLTGSSFGISGFVSIGSSTCSVLAPADYSHTSIKCKVNPGEGANLPIKVTGADGRSSSEVFTFSYAKPVVTSVTPVTGGTDGRNSGGSQIVLTVTGTSFGTSSVVAVGSSPCPVVGRVANTKVLCNLPAGMGIADVFVTTGGLSSVASSQTKFTYDPPQLTSVSPNSNIETKGGQLLRLQGNNFGLSGSVTVGGISCTVSSWSHNLVQCIAPASQGTQSVVLTSASQNSGSQSIQYGAPQFSSVTPSTGPTAGLRLTVTGNNFGIGSSFTFKFRGNTLNPASFTPFSHESFQFLLPPGTGKNHSFEMNVAGQSTDSSANGVYFSYAAPTVTSVKGCPSQNGPVATECIYAGNQKITIEGTNFGQAPGAVSVLIDGVACTVTSATHTAIQCNMGQHPSAGFGVSVNVTVDGQQAPAQPFVSFSGPQVVANTLRILNTQPSTAISIKFDGASPTFYDVQFNVNNVGAQQPNSITYGTDDIRFNCPLQSFVAGSPALVTCRVSIGVGKDLTFKITVGSLTSAAGTDTLSYQSPAILPGTLRNGLSATPQNPLPGSNSEGDVVYFDADFLGNNASLVSVKYGESGTGVFDKQCSDVKFPAAAVSTNTKQPISCRMDFGSGDGYIFKISALNSDSLPGTDQYNYVSSPTVDKVIGCGGPANGNGVTGCSTVGGETIEIFGTAFLQLGLSVKVAGESCSNVKYISATKITCQIPPGTGLNRPILVLVGKIFSQAQPYISYAVPVVNSITSTACTAQGTDIKDCPRPGNVAITLSGSNFGASNAIVLVGGAACNSVVHVASKPHEQVTCTLPSGTTIQRAVLFIQNAGEVSKSLKYVSYAQCQPGTAAAQGVVACTNCTAGLYSDTVGALQCKSCDVGSVSSISGASKCNLCPKGTYSNTPGQSQCNLCSSGKFSPALGQVICSSCGPGTYAAGSGKSTCDPCAAGKFTDVQGSEACKSCTLGRYTDSVGKVSCSVCEPGSIASAFDSTSCTLCAPGSFAGSAGLSSCTPCPKGFKAEFTGMGACVACDSGTFVNTTGAQTCDRCPSGKFSQKQGSNGPQACQDCAPGTYVETQGQPSCLACPKGEFSKISGSTKCSKCPAGSISIKIGSTSCDLCEVGKFTSGTGSVVCDVCPTGTYTNINGSSSCSGCPVGHYQSQTGSSSCQPCPKGMAMQFTGQAVCSACDGGSFANTTGLTRCFQCGIGKFSKKSSNSVSGPEVCQLCPAGTKGESLGLDACTACPPGSFVSSAGQTQCQRCPSGKFNNQVGSSFCSNCTSGQFSLSGAVQCDICGVGKYGANPGSSSCQLCSPGKAQLQTGQQSCKPCAVGYFTVSNGELSCAPCPAGKFNNATGLSECFSCAAGTAQNNAGQSSCKACTPGYYQPAPGQANCIACKAGQFSSLAGQLSCTLCSPGTASSQPGSNRCFNCTAGFFAANSGSVQCDKCNAGRISQVSGARQCVNCEVGKVQPSPGETQCVVCPRGSYTNREGRLYCSSCPKGRFANTTSLSECIPCAAGKFAASEGMFFCLNCQAGKFTINKESVACQPCNSGTFTNQTGSQSCQLCEEGKYQDTTGKSSCTPCAAGTAVAVKGQNSCESCEAGTYASQSGLHKCVRCSAGTYSPRGAQVCSNCTTGQFQAAEGQGTCRDCPLGFYSNETGATECNRCEVGRFGGELGKSVCNLCSAGYFSPTEASFSCKQCPNGRFNNLTGQVDCQSCEKGSSNGETGKSACSPCNQGKFANVPGMASCIPCEVGKFQSGRGKTACEKCLVGTATAEAGQLRCQACSPGHFAAVIGSVVCESCLPGSASQTESATICNLCTPGRHQYNSRGAACIDCDPGKYAAGKGELQCTGCSPGKFGPNQTMSSCVRCPIGKFQDGIGSSVCKECEAGWYMDLEGQSKCKKCPRGQYVNETGATSCSLCPAGRFNGEEGQPFCLSCESGKYQESNGTFACLDCKKGRYSDSRGSLQCDDCSPGSFAESLGQNLCGACPAGRFQSAPGQSECVDCSTGDYGNMTGLSRCFQCNPGEYSAEPKQTQCTPCEVGKSQSEFGTNNCRECEKGKFSGSTGSTACESCPSGTVAEQFMSVRCAVCQVGQYAIDPKEPCQACPAGRFSAIQQASTCQDCSPGRAQSEAGKSFCSECQAGTFAGRKAAQCSVCDRTAKKVAPRDGMSECEKCGEGGEPNNDGTQCRCEKGTYSLIEGSGSSNSTGGLSLKCQKCDPCALCDEPGITAETLRVREGCWAGNSTGAIKYYKCIVPEHCLGGRDQGTCNKNRDPSSPLCAFCLPGYESKFASKGECTVCPKQESSYGFSAMVMAFVFAGLLGMYYLILRLDRELIVEMQLRDKQKTMARSGMMEFSDDFREEVARDRRIASLEGIHTKPNFVYKMKIVLGFMQIGTNLATNVDIPWPSYYRAFINIFNFANFDFIRWASFSCVVNSESYYYVKFMVILGSPPALFLVLFLVYYAPSLVRDRMDISDRDDYRHRRSTSRRQFWKLTIFTILLIYPFVSSTVVKYFNCREVEGVNYLLADLRVICGEGDWNNYLTLAIAGTIAYPIMIPVTFFFILWRSYKNDSLHKPKMRLQIGMLYDAYTDTCWWFDLCDLSNKLFLTSLLVFFGENQMVAGMAWITGYTILLLVKQPYLRKGDDRLHLLCNCELYMLMLISHVIKSNQITIFEETEDVLLSMLLIFLTCAFLIYFVMQLVLVIRKMWRQRKRDQRQSAAEKSGNQQHGGGFSDLRSMTFTTEGSTDKLKLAVDDSRSRSGTAAVGGFETNDVSGMVGRMVRGNSSSTSRQEETAADI